MAALNLIPGPTRIALLRAGGMKIGRRTRIEAGIVTPTNHVTVGQDCYINIGCILDAGTASIFIEDDVNIGAYVVLAANSHEIGPSNRRASGNIAANIRIGAGTWIGASVTILPGVCVGAGCVIGAGSVVVADTLADHTYAGVPAKPLRPLS